MITTEFLTQIVNWLAIKQAKSYFGIPEVTVFFVTIVQGLIIT